MTEYSEIKQSHKRNIRKFHMEMDQNGKCSFNDFLRATLVLFPFAEIDQQEGEHLIINTNLIYVEDDEGELVVVAPYKPKDV